MDGYNSCELFSFMIVDVIKNLKLKMLLTRQFTVDCFTTLQSVMIVDK